MRFSFLSILSLASVALAAPKPAAAPQPQGGFAPTGVIVVPGGTVTYPLPTPTTTKPPTVLEPIWTTLTITSYITRVTTINASIVTTVETTTTEVPIQIARFRKLAKYEVNPI